MINLNVIVILLLVLVTGCSGVKFLGAEKYIGGSLYKERWFLNPDNKDFKSPKGTAFYGAAAEKIKHKYIIKYYIAERDGDSTIEIPSRDMWKVRHNGKHYTEQDDDNLFFYVKNSRGLFSKFQISDYDCCISIDEDDKFLPIKECYENGWCKLYPTEYLETLYVKKSILYQ